MTVTQRTYEFTVADLDVLPEDGSRYEVIDGELYVTHAPDLRHQAAIDQIASAFTTWRAAKPGRGLAVTGAGVVFAFSTGVIPDLLWVSSARLASIIVDPATGRPAGRFFQAPDLLVEVVSPGSVHEKRDRETKLTLYARRGAREYWIVDRQRQSVEVYRRTRSATLELSATLGEGDVVTSPLLPDFALPVATIFSLPPEVATLIGTPEG